MDNVKRDLNEDLRICAEATEGYDATWAVDDHVDYAYVVAGNYVMAEATTKVARFIAEARTGWPHAIERAVEAEEELAEATRHWTHTSGLYDWSAQLNRGLIEENERLRILFRELMAHVSEPFLAYSDAEHAVKFYANHVRETAEYVHNTAKEALYDGRQSQAGG